MDIKILIALIAAGSSLIVSITTGLIQIWQIKEKNRLEQQLAEEARSKAISTAELQNVQSAIRLSCAAIQGVQDELEFLIKGGRESIRSNARRNRLVAASDELLCVYREHHSVLPLADSDALKAAREVAVHVILMLDLEREWQSELQISDGSALNQLERASASLGIRHQQLLLSALGALPASTTER